jgi:hypothetical protein
MFKLTLDEGLPTYLNGVRGDNYQYQVNGMPDGQKAFTTKKSGSILEPRWEVRIEENGVTSEWVGDYETKEDALAAIQKEVDPVAA